MSCRVQMIAEGEALIPRSCPECGLGPCKYQNDIKTGSWGRERQKLPPEVVKAFNKLCGMSDDSDWIQMSADGQNWLIARLYMDADTWTVVAAVIRAEEDCGRGV